MTKKDYELIANVIRYNFEKFQDLDIDPSHWQSLLASEMATALKETNPRFDRERFLKACGIED